jgi:hypothetical protein
MTLKDLLAKIPYTADLYDPAPLCFGDFAIRPVRPRTRYNLSQLEQRC